MALPHWTRRRRDSSPSSVRSPTPVGPVVTLQSPAEDSTPMGRDSDAPFPTVKKFRRHMKKPSKSRIGDSGDADDISAYSAYDSAPSHSAATAEVKPARVIQSNWEPGESSGREGISQFFRSVRHRERRDPPRPVPSQVADILVFEIHTCTKVSCYYPVPVVSLPSHSLSSSLFFFFFFSQKTLTLYKSKGLISTASKIS